MASSGKKTYYQSLDVLRLVLAFFVCIKALGAPTLFSSYLQAFSTFIIPSFYIINGFLVLRESSHFEQRLRRAIKRSGITFLVLMGFYALCSVLIQPYLNASFLDGIRPFLSKSALVEFLIFNIWPLTVGGTIWFLQGLFYGYVIIYLLHRFGLMKLEKILLPLLLVFSYTCGEFAGVLHINPLGRHYISSNFLTSALPYLLLGRLLNTKRHTLQKKHRLFFLMLSVAGLILFALEHFLLGSFGMLLTTSQFVGTTVFAAAICCYCFTHPYLRRFSSRPVPGNRIAKLVYWLHNPIGLVLRIILLNSSVLTFFEMTDYLGILVYMIILIGAFFRQNFKAVLKSLRQLRHVLRKSFTDMKQLTPKQRIQRMKDSFRQFGNSRPLYVRTIKAPTIDKETLTHYVRNEQQKLKRSPLKSVNTRSVKWYFLVERAKIRRLWRTSQEHQRERQRNQEAILELRGSRWNRFLHWLKQVRRRIAQGIASQRQRIQQQNRMLAHRLKSAFQSSHSKRSSHSQHRKHHDHHEHHHHEHHHSH